jgi:hypothetical protein
MMLLVDGDRWEGGLLWMESPEVLWWLEALQKL